MDKFFKVKQPEVARSTPAASSSSSSSSSSAQPAPVAVAETAKAKKAAKSGKKRKLTINNVDNEHDGDDAGVHRHHRTRGAANGESEEDSDYELETGKRHCDVSTSGSDSESDDDFLVIADNLQGRAAIACLPTELTLLPLAHAKARPRVVRSGKHPEAGNRTMTNSRPSDPKGITPAARARDVEFAGNFLRVSNGKLFCGACCKEVATRRSSLRKHCSGTNHVDEVAKLAAKSVVDAVDKTILSFCKTKDAARRETGESFTLPTTVKAERMEVAYAMLEDTVGFELLNSNSASGMRNMLERDRPALPYRELRDLIPDILELLRGFLQCALKLCKAIALIIDGTPNVAEVFGVVVRYVDADNKVQQKCLALEFYEKGFTAADLMAVLVDLLIGKWQFPRESIRFFMTDGCPVNAAGLTAMIPLCPFSAQVICMSHSANVVGKIIWSCLPLAKAFEEKWGSMVTMSFRARQIFKSVAFVQTKTSSETRWYNGWEIGKQCYDHSLAVNTVVHHPDEFSTASRESLRAMLDNNLDELRIELGLLVDSGVELVKLCYYQEGDRPFLCVTTFDHWNNVLNHLRKMTNPNTSVPRLRAMLPSVAAVIDTLELTNLQKSQAIHTSAQRLVPVHEKMQDDTINRLAGTLSIFRACRLFGYKYTGAVGATVESLTDELVHILNIAKCFDIGEDALVGELEEYRRRAVAAVAANNTRRVTAADEAGDAADDHHDLDMSEEMFWNVNALHLPIWFEASREVVLICPSSAGCERLFSLMTNGFNAQQGRALDDYILASVMIRYNRERID
jgi:hypothetical protein